jgi:hypothetical protein
VTVERDENRVANESVPVHQAAPFLSALAWVAAAWAVGAVAVGIFCLVASTVASLDPLAAGVITSGSGLIACGAMLAGGWLYRQLSPRSSPADSEPNHAQANALLAATLAGMFLRLVGTVALFLSCRYHLAASVEVIGTMTVAWYLYLTSVEVAALARELKRFDLAPGQQGGLAAIHRPTVNARS